MNPNLSTFSIRYRIALKAHLKKSERGGNGLANAIGRQAAAIRVNASDLANLHESILMTSVLAYSGKRERASLTRRAGAFLAVALVQSARNNGDTAHDSTLLSGAVKALSLRTVELAAANREMRREIAQRISAEAALKESQSHYHLLHEQLTALSRQVLSAHEDERRRISRELHDVVAQTLTGINLRLSTFQKEAGGVSKSLDRNIARTQRLVEQSVNTVHQFARQLRPTVLDDLGLIPALHSHLKSFTAATGIHVHLTVFAAVEKLSIEKRTTLFRVAQEALNNAARHSNAANVDVVIQRVGTTVTMQIKDDGNSFDAKGTMDRNRGKRLGLVGMKERVEIMGGAFRIESSPGNGCTITAQLSSRNASLKRPPNS